MNDASSLERERIRAAFGRAAERYDSAAGLQRRAAERLLVHVGALNVEPVRILDAGCGTGYGAALLAAQYGGASIACVDLAHAMVARAKSTSGTGAMQYVCADAAQLPFGPGAFDLVWSNAMLQWCNEPEGVLLAFHEALDRSGAMALATFGPATLHELRTSFDGPYTHVSRFPSADFLREAAQSAGFQAVSVESRTTVLRYPSVRELLDSIKTIGAGNATQGRSRGLMGKTRWARMQARYERLREPTGLPATYELLYLTALKR